MKINDRDKNEESMQMRKEALEGIKTVIMFHIYK